MNGFIVSLQYHSFRRVCHVLHLYHTTRLLSEYYPTVMFMLQMIRATQHRQALIMSQMLQGLQENLFDMIIIERIINRLALFPPLDDAQIPQISQLMRYS